MSNNSEINNLLAAGVASMQADPATDDFLIVPDGYHLVDLEKFHDEPRLINQLFTARTLGSFLAYYEKFATEQTVIFAHEGNGEIVCVLDYHHESPEWCKHRIVYTLPTSTEWSIWKKQSGRSKTQAEFALFIEDNILDITEPDGASMLEIAQTLKAKKNVNYLSSVNLHNGDVQFTYEADTQAQTKGNVSVPASFKVGLSPFKGADRYEIKCRLKYRISDDGHLSMWYELVRPDLVHEQAFADVVKQIDEATESMVFEGSI